MTRLEFTVDAEKGGVIDVWPKDTRGERLPCVEARAVDQELASEYEDYHEMCRDLSSAVQGLEFLKLNPAIDPIPSRSIMSHVVVSYSRPFISGYGRARKLSADRETLGESDEATHIHDFLRSLRDKVVGHTDNTNLRARFSYVEFDSAKTPRRALRAHAFHIIYAGFHESQIDPLLMHVNNVLRVLEGRLAELQAKLVRKAQATHG